MAYADTYRSRPSAGTIAAVAVLHVAVGYALVTGLVGTVFPAKEPPLAGYQLPTDPPKPQPAPQPTETARTIDRATVVRNPLAPAPMPTFTVDPGPSTFGTEDGIGTALFPTPTPEPTFSPTPRFTPRPAAALGDPNRWVTPDDYPTRELRLGHEGTTRFRLSIGTDGRVSGCTVTRSSGWPALDAAACAKLAARGRFKAATGEDGEKTAGSYASSVLWDIPEE